MPEYDTCYSSVCKILSTMSRRQKALLKRRPFEVNQFRFILSRCGLNEVLTSDKIEL